MSNKYINYYLLYKTISSPNLWIVNIYETIDNSIIKHVKNFISRDEVYYLVAKVENYKYDIYDTCYDYDYLIDDFKRFTIFNIDDSCELICQSR